LVAVDDITSRRLIVASVANDCHAINVATMLSEAVKLLRTSPAPLVAFFDYELPDATFLDVLPAVGMGGAQ
jgi:CheY-like chemotaxis protein